MNEDPIQDHIDALERQQEYISRIAMSVGFLWNQLDTDARAALMDHLNGSPGLHEKIVEWAAEFDTWWEALAPEDGRHDEYPDQIDTFAETKIKTLIAEVRLSN